MGTPVRIAYAHRRISFAVLECDVVVTGVNGKYRTREKFYYWWFDPLTSRGGEGMCFARPGTVLALEALESTPVTCEYTIDSAVTFSWDNGVRYGLPEVSEAFARAFLQAIIDCLASHDLPLIQVSDEKALCIRNTDLTNLGLDFMRQHYHNLKEAALAQQRVPSQADLRRLLALTENHRTTDDDWQLGQG